MITVGGVEFGGGKNNLEENKVSGDTNNLSKIFLKPKIYSRKLKVPSKQSEYQIPTS
jgi:hypothetical protein